MANLTKRNGIYYIEYRDDRGKHQRSSCRTRNREAAEKLLREFEGTGTTRKTLPISVHLAAYWPHLAVSNKPQQVADARTRINKILKATGCTRVEQLTASRVTQAVAGFKHHQTGEPLTVESRTKYVKSIKHFTRWIHSERRHDADPLIGLQNKWGPSNARKRTRLTDEEWQALAKYLGSAKKVLNDWSPEERLRMYRLAVCTGLRRTELSQATPEWFDLGAGRMTVPAAAAKASREDVVLLGGESIQWLRTWLPGLPARQELFPRLRAVRPAAMLRRDLRDAGVGRWREFVFHDLRHTFVSRMWDAGLTNAEVMRQARHRDIKTTARYSHVDQSRLMDKLQGL